LQRLGLPVLFLIPLLALFGLLGEHFATAHASGAGVTLDARYPDRAHYRQPLSIRVHVRNDSPTTMDSVAVVLDSAFMSGFSDVSVSATLNGAYVARLTGLAPGESRQVNAMVSGEIAGRHAGAISVITPLGTVRAPVATFVFP
jgi:hypothetical protein